MNEPWRDKLNCFSRQYFLPVKEKYVSELDQQKHLNMIYMANASKGQRATHAIYAVQIKLVNECCFMFSNIQLNRGITLGHTIQHAYASTLEGSKPSRVSKYLIRRPLSPKGRRVGRVCLCPCLSDDYRRH